MMIFTDTYIPSAPDMQEIKRYAFCGKAMGSDEGLEKAIHLAEGKLTYRVRHGRFPITVDGKTVDFGFMQVKSAALAENLSGCTEAEISCATVGLALDQLIKTTMVTDMATSLWLNAMGTERVEALCDAFCQALEKENAYIRPRFSPGYGDFSISYQKHITEALEAFKIGVYLSDSMLMVPSKTVTAVVGIGQTQCKGDKAGCAHCGRADCAFRKI